MAVVTGTGTLWNLPNFSGELFTADPTQTPFLTMIGGLSGGMVSNSFMFPTAQLYNHPDPEQPDISENASITAPAPSHIAREQKSNVVQIHQEAIDITYVKQSNMGVMSGLNIAGQIANPTNEVSWQLQQKLIKVARDVEHSFIAGQFQQAGNANTANRTRGMIQLTQTPEGVNIDAAGAPLSREMLDEAYRLMFENGAMYSNPVLFVNAKLKQVITKIYNLVVGFALPPTRNVGGLDIQEIEFDFGRLGIVTNRFMPHDAVLIADLAYCAPVFQEVPEKGILFTEPLAKIGASDREMLFGQIGLDHGPAFMHGSITGIAI
jgi:hypothetical protein